jgi:hypothetical protein
LRRLHDAFDVGVQIGLGQAVEELLHRLRASREKQKEGGEQGEEKGETHGR